VREVKLDKVSILTLLSERSINVKF